MLYVNGGHGVSLGLSPERNFAPYGKGSTEGQRKLYAAAIRAVKSGPVFTGDLAAHTEGGYCAPVTCDVFTMVGTDVAEIGGMKLDSDGGYIVAFGHIVKSGQPLVCADGS